MEKPSTPPNRFVDEMWATQRCSFCGKRPDEDPSTLFQGIGSARICDNCIRQFSSQIGNSKD